MPSWHLYCFSKIAAITQCFGRPTISHRSKHEFGTETKRIPLLIRGKPNEIAVDSDMCRYNGKIKDFGRHGKVSEARKVFDEMPQRDKISYASMISVYVKSNDLSAAEKLFRTIPRREIVSECAMIDAYVKAGRVDDARKVFHEMSERNVFSWTSLIYGYIMVGRVDEGRRLFDIMPVRKAHSWIMVILGYAQNGLIDEARNVFEKMPDKDVVAWTAMMKSYVENDGIDEAFKLFHEMPQRNLYSWNIMISACLSSSRVTEAMQLFNSMPQRNRISWTCMVSGLARNGMIKLAREHFDQMPNKDETSWNALITAYVHEGDMAEASALFQFMPSRDIVSWNAIIDGFSRNGPEGEALRHLILMLHHGFRPNETTITSVLTSCIGMLELTQAHALVIFLGFKNDTSLTNSLITMYSRTGDMNSARLAFEGLKTKDLVSWTSMILTYSNHGYGQHALNVFAQMLRAGISPDEITFVGILSACSHAGLVEKGERLFDSMSRAYGLQPNPEHYSCLVDILGRAGQVEKAMSVFSKMPPSENIDSVLGALLGACRLHGDGKLANRIGQKLIELEPANSIGYVLLAQTYAASGKWDEFSRVRKMMREKNVKKVPGISQIEVKGKIHVFFVEDKSHPQVQEIYDMLRNTVMPLMQEETCIQKCSII